MHVLWETQLCKKETFIICCGGINEGKLFRLETHFPNSLKSLWSLHPQPEGETVHLDLNKTGKTPSSTFAESCYREPSRVMMKNVTLSFTALSPDTFYLSYIVHRERERRLCVILLQ